MNRKEIRYLLFRIRSEEEGVSKVGAKSLPKGFKKGFSTQKKFQGWNNFGVTWDVGGREPNEDNPHEDATSREPSPWVIVMRDESLDAEWNKVLTRVVVPLPVKEIKP